MTNEVSAMITDEAVVAVMDRILGAEHTGGWPARDNEDDPFTWVDTPFALTAAQGDLLYLLARASGASRVVEFATSLGFSTLFLASAVRDNGGGLVIGTEIVPDKAHAAEQNLRDAGLGDLVQVAIGDARQTLASIDGPIDMVLIDGWPTEDSPSLSLQVLKILEPKLRPGALVIDDNHEPDFLEYVREPANGYRSLSVPVTKGRKSALEVSVRQ